MKFKDFWTVFLLSLCAAGCVTSSGVVPMGRDTYMISRTVKSFVGSSAPVKAEAIKEAESYCKKQGKEMLITKTVQSDMKPFQSDASVEIYFKCLSPDDPALKTPNKIEEIRN